MPEIVVSATVARFRGRAVSSREIITVTLEGVVDLESTKDFDRLLSEVHEAALGEGSRTVVVDFSLVSK